MPGTKRILLRSSASEDVTPEDGVLLGHALAMDHRRVVVARDLMKSSTMMRDALVSGLLSSGADIIDLGIASGPAVAMAARMGDCAAYVTEYRGYGMVSGYLLMNKDGSLFRTEQMRHLEKYIVDPPALPDAHGLGTLHSYENAVTDYNRRLREVTTPGSQCSVVLDCNCGPVADSAPQILNAAGADVLAINAQRDPEFRTDDMTEFGQCPEDVRRLVSHNPGCIGVAMNKIGTMMTLFDENGEELAPEETFALIVAYLRPSSIAIPLDMTSLAEDAFMGRLLGEPRDPSERAGIVRTANRAGAVCEKVAAGCDIGYYDGGILFGDVSAFPDGIRAASAIAAMAGSTSINKLVESFPRYRRDGSEVRCDCGRERFERTLEEMLGASEWEWANLGNAWRVDMDGGWFMIETENGPEPLIRITAESEDRAYLVGLMEVAENLVDGCVKAQ